MDLESARCASDERKSNWNDCFEEYLEKTLKCNVPWPKTKSVSTPECDNGDNIYIYALHKDTLFLLVKKSNFFDNGAR
jgi:hypothetical protein